MLYVNLGRNFCEKAAANCLGFDDQPSAYAWRSLLTVVHGGGSMVLDAVCTSAYLLDESR